MNDSAFVVKEINEEQWHGKAIGTIFSEDLAQDCIIYYGHEMLKVKHQEDILNVGVLLEAAPSIPQLMAMVNDLNFASQFDYIYTFDQNLLAKDPEKYLFFVVGGCWVASSDRQIHSKNKLCSLIASSKNLLTGHKLRHEIADRFGSKLNGIFGSGYTTIPQKITGLKEYMFSLAIENCREPYYMTEKLIDCFITGTVPIYWGANFVTDFFNPDGIILFTEIAELEDIFTNLNADLYQKMLPAIQQNFQIALENYTSYDPCVRVYPDIPDTSVIVNYNLHYDTILKSHCR